MSNPPPPSSVPATDSFNGFHPIHISKSAIVALTSPLAPSAIRRVMGESAGGAPRRRAGNLCENLRGSRCQVAGGGPVGSGSGSVPLGWSRQGSWCRGTRDLGSRDQGGSQPPGKIREFAESSWQGPPKCHPTRLRSFHHESVDNRHFPAQSKVSTMEGSGEATLTRFPPPLFPAHRSGHRLFQRPSKANS